MTNPMSFEPLLNFSSWLVDAMEEQDITLKALAKKSGVSENAIAGYRSGSHEPSLFAVCCLTSALGYTLGVIQTPRRHNADK